MNKRGYIVKLIAFVEVEAVISVEASTSTDAFSAAESLLKDRILKNPPEANEVSVEVVDFDQLACDRASWITE